MTSSFFGFRRRAAAGNQDLDASQGNQRGEDINNQGQVTTGMGGIGQVRAPGAREQLVRRSMEVPQERSIPGLPGPGESDQYGPPRIQAAARGGTGERFVEGRSSQPDLPRIERNRALELPRGALSEKVRTPSGVVLDTRVKEPAARLTDYARWSAQTEPTPSAQTLQARQERRKEGDVAPQILQNGGEELLQTLTSRQSPAERPFEGPLVEAGRGRNENRAYLSADSDTLEARQRQNDQDFGDPSEQSLSRSSRGSKSDIIGGTWTDSKSDNIQSVVQMPWAERNGQVGMRNVDPSQVVETVNRNAGDGSIAPIRVNDRTVIEPDSAQTSETFYELTAGEALRSVRDANRTPLISRDALNYAAQNTIAGQDGRRARRATPGEQKGSLVGFLRSTGRAEEGPQRGQMQAGQVIEPIYDANGKVTVNREIPDGLFGSKQVDQAGFRRGNPLGNNYDQIREDLNAPLQPGYKPQAGDPIQTPLVPGMGVIPQRGPARVFPATLDQLQQQGAQFFGTDRPMPAGHWSEAFTTVGEPGESKLAVATVVRRPGEQPIPLRAVVDDNGETRILIGDNQGSRYVGPAIFSPDEAQRRKAEGLAGNASEQMADFIASSGSGGRDVKVGYSGGASTIEQVLARNASGGRINPDQLKQALLASAKNKTTLEATQQGIAARNPGQRVDLFDESNIGNDEAVAIRQQALSIADSLPTNVDPITLASIAAPGTYQRQVLDAVLAERSGQTPYASAAPDRTTALWSNGREAGVDPYAVNRFNRWAQSDVDALESGRNEAINQALLDEAQGAITADNLQVREQDDPSFGPDAQNFWGDFGAQSAAGSSSKRATDVAMPAAGIGQLELPRAAVEYANALTGGRNPDAAARIAITALVNTRRTVDGRPAEGIDVFRNIEELAGTGVDPLYARYALQFTGDGSFGRAATIVDTAQRSAAGTPGQPVAPAAVLNAIEQLSGGQVGSGYDSFSRGKQIAYQRVGEPYRAAAPGMRDIDYGKYATILGNPEDPNFDKAMAFAAERIRRLREAG